MKTWMAGTSPAMTSHAQHEISRRDFSREADRRGMARRKTQSGSSCLAARGRLSARHMRSSSEAIAHQRRAQIGQRPVAHQRIAQASRRQRMLFAVACGIGPRFLRRSKFACERQLAPSRDSYWSREELRHRPSAHAACMNPRAPHPVPPSVRLAKRPSVGRGGCQCMRGAKGGDNFQRAASHDEDGPRPRIPQGGRDGLEFRRGGGGIGIVTSAMCQ